MAKIAQVLPKLQVCINKLSICSISTTTTTTTKKKKGERTEKDREKGRRT
jgi:hypothetical protein